MTSSLKTNIIPVLNVLLIFAISPQAFGQSEGKYRIELREKVTISGEDVMLKDIADLTGAPSGLMEELTALRIGQAPIPGRERILNSSVVSLRLKQKNLDTFVELGGSEWVKVKSTSTTLSLVEIEGLVFAYVKANFAGDAEGVRVDILNPPKEIRISGEDAEITFKSPQGFVPPGRSVLHMWVNKGKRFGRRVLLPINTRTYENVFVAATSISRGSGLTKDEVKQALRETTNMPEGSFVTSWDSIIGKRTTRGISANHVIRKDMLENPTLITRGDKVTLMIRSKFFVIQTPGLARENGHLSDMIEVQPLPSGKIVTAMILNSTTVVAEL